jgi:hypothetical protein
MANKAQQLEAEDAIEKPYDASDKEQVSEARKKAGRKKKEEREDYISLMETERGRKFIWKFCAAAVIGDPVVPGDSLSTYFNLGQERKARELFRELLKVVPALVAKMVEENIEK